MNRGVRYWLLAAVRAGEPVGHGDGGHLRIGGTAVVRS